MKSSEICIIHLSDLHFSAEEKYKSVYNALIDDIATQIVNDENLIIVATGDFATKGAVSESHEDIVNFFKKIIRKIPRDKRILDVEIVPGNHDVTRPNVENKFNNGSFKPIGHDFAKLRQSLYEAIGREGIVDKPNVGVSFVPHLGNKIAFVRIDTSAFSTCEEWRREIKDDIDRHKDLWDASEYNNLSIEEILQRRKSGFEEIAREQKFELGSCFKKEVEKNCDHQPFLTFAVSHHPLTLLNTTGFDELADILFKRGLYFADALICGHKHRAQLFYSMENAQQRIMLMSGVGWQESQNTQMRYSLYRISLERNTCQVRVRSTTEGAAFAPDYSVGDDGESEFSRTNHYTLPLKSQHVGGVIYLPSPKKDLEKGVFVDQKTIALLPQVSSSLLGFQESLHEKLQAFKAKIRVALRKTGCRLSCIESALTPHKSQTKGCSVKTKQLISSTVKKSSALPAMLKDICSLLRDMLDALNPVEDAVDASGRSYGKLNVIWRVHYRVYRGVKSRVWKKSKDKYWCKFEASNREKCSHRPTSIPWGGLIRGAFESERKVLINSAVPGLNEYTKTEWSDFMTICPSFPGSALLMKRKDSQRNEIRPIVTFGISFKVEDYVSLQYASRTLYLLEYLELEKILDHFLGKFVRFAHIQAPEIGDYL